MEGCSTVNAGSPKSENQTHAIENIIYNDLDCTKPHCAMSESDSKRGLSDSEDTADRVECAEGEEGDEGDGKEDRDNVDGDRDHNEEEGDTSDDSDDSDADAVIARKITVQKNDTQDADSLVSQDAEKTEEEDNEKGGDKDEELSDIEEEEEEDTNATAKHRTSPKTEETEESKDYCVEVFEVLVDQAESRLSARRAARAEARDIRMRELEKQQKEMEQKHDRIYEITSNSVAAPATRVGGRRGSDDSTSSEDHRELRKQVAELEEKYKKAMMNNAQLDNEKQTYRFQVDQLKDKLEDLEEQCIEVTRLHKDRCKDLEQKKRDYKDLQLENEYHKAQLDQRDQLIKEYNLVFVNNDLEEKEEKKGRRKKKKDPQQVEGTAALITRDALEILSQHEGNLDERLKQLHDEKLQLEDENRRLKQQLEDEREKKEMAEKYASPKRDSSKVNNGPTEMQLMEVQMEAQKQVNDYKFRLSKAEQDITMLEGNIVRLESQVKRYKTAAESSEKLEDELKADKRKLTRELRESMIQIEELQSTNEHLKMRMEKIRQAGRSQLTK